MLLIFFTLSDDSIYKLNINFLDSVLDFIFVANLSFLLLIFSFVVISILKYFLFFVSQRYKKQDRKQLSIFSTLVPCIFAAKFSLTVGGQILKLRSNSRFI